MRQWLLVGKFGAGGETRSKLIDPVPFRIGRRPEASLTLPRATVSGLHADLFTRDDRLFVRDLGSTNGTFINGERIRQEAELEEDDVIQFADVALKIACEVDDPSLMTMSEDFHQHALARVQFENLIHQQNVVPYFQPIVNLHSSHIHAFEVLARSTMVGLETPGKMFAAAADLQMERDLSHVMRVKGIEVSRQFVPHPHIYLNTHPAEFINETSWDWVAQLRELAPRQALSIEVHEAAITDVTQIARFRALLRDYEIGLAFDDFGAGQARIVELAGARPDCLKFDRKMIMGLDRAHTTHQRFVRCLVDAIRDIGVTPLAEGIETLGEYQICCELGFELAQGYLLGVPNPVEIYQHWREFELSDGVLQNSIDNRLSLSQLDQLMSLPLETGEHLPVDIAHATDEPG